MIQKLEKEFNEKINKINSDNKKSAYDKFRLKKTAYSKFLSEKEKTKK